jgi:hypothetical protein
MPRVRDRVVLTPEAAGRKKSARGAVPRSRLTSTAEGASSNTAPKLGLTPWSKREPAAESVKPFFMAIVGSRFSVLPGLGLALSAPAHLPAKNRFGIFGLEFHKGGHFRFFRD